MRINIALTGILLGSGIIIFLPHNAHAQMQQGYADGKPDVTIDRSVLQDLKDYQPPPMFENPAPEAVAVPPPAQQTISKTSKQVNPKERLTIIDPRAPKKESGKKESVTSAKTNKKKSADPIRAVPLRPVEKADLLPSLPPTMPSDAVPAKPSAGDRLMDAALTRHIETDETAIKEKLATEPQRSTTAPPPSSRTINNPIDHKIGKNTLVFSRGENNVSDKMKATLREQILPALKKTPESRIQILSFASAPDSNESTARRIALSRALAVRDELKTLKVDLSRIDIRAMPSQGSIPPDKIDIVPLPE